MTARRPHDLEPAQFRETIRHALAEDLGRGRDLTTRAVVRERVEGRARISSRQEGRVAGLDLALWVFRELDPGAFFESAEAEGADVVPEQTVAVVRADVAALLTAERTALNFLGHLSGIATATRAMVREVEGTGATLVDTRKTTPGLRELEKYAVRVGGGSNHRFGLDDAVLIKDNHLVIAGSVGEALRRARQSVGHMIKIEIEVEDLEQLDEAIAGGADAVLLDNMPAEMLQAAVERAKGLVVLEASGGVEISTVRQIAEAGVDLISCGAITHSAPALDLSMALETDEAEDGSKRHSRSISTSLKV